ncbi:MULTISPECIES: hypothetical protein [unclassified Acidovorax]|uniref:hypothetical protein n=1 Tax=unclassified Acidovorax TaxID=2684926 RepID=UPI002882E874|nr:MULTISPECIES: hypothetical protein [unclassified Acidovorax]
MPLNHTSQYSEITEAQYAALGKAVVEWANVEFLLGVLLSRLLGTPEFLARTYTDSISAVRLQEAITEAVEIHRVRYRHRLASEQVLLEISQVNLEVTTLRSMRNKIAHFCWVRSHDEELFGTSFRGGALSTKKERRDHAVLTSSELSKLNDDAYSLVEQLMKLIAKFPEVHEESILSNSADPAHDA